MGVTIYFRPLIYHIVLVNLDPRGWKMGSVGPRSIVLFAF